VTEAADLSLRWIQGEPEAPLQSIEVRCAACDVRVRIVVHALELSDAAGVKAAAEQDALRQFERVHPACRGRPGSSAG
jgi:hypothetical protein